MSAVAKPDSSARGRRVALFMAGVGVFWMLAFALGAEYDWSQRLRALFDLIALAGFGAGLWMGFRLWRERNDDEG